MNYSISDLISNRQKDILWQVIENYIETGEPVASQTIANKLGVSSATIRNDFVSLDELNLTASPHTSAGRIPTTSALKFYIEKIKEKNSPLSTRYQNQLTETYQEARTENEALRNLAKQMAEIVQNIVAINLDNEIVFITGLSYIFCQPEFANQKNILNLSHLIDNLENNFSKLRQDMPQKNEWEILLGADNPFGPNYGLVVLPFEKHLFTIFGPTRMHYDRAASCLSFVRELLNS